MAAWTEQQARERLIQDFIQEDPVEIELVRPTYTTSAAGGRTETGSITIDAQIFYYQPFKRRLTREYHYNPQSYGEDKVEDVDYILVCPPDADIEVNDYFDTTVNGRLEAGRYTVEFISPRQWDRVQAGVRYRG